MSINWRKYLDFCLLVYLFLFLLQLPNVPVINEHDLGSQAAYEYWLFHGFQYGIDFLQNVGPYGFLNYPIIYSGFYFYTKIFLNIFLVVSLLYLIPKFNFTFFLILILSLSLYNRQDVFVYILLHVAFMCILQQNLKHIQVIALFIVALLCLSKSTCLFITLWGILILVVKSHVQNEQYIWKVLLFLFFILLLWLFADQSIFGFFYYIKGAVIFSSGYNEAMAVQEPFYVTFSALFVCLYYLFQITETLLIVHKRFKVDLLFASLFLVFLLFTIWKHAIVRADDGHISILFAYILFATCFHKFFAQSEVKVTQSKDDLKNSYFVVVILLSFIFLFLPSQETLDKYIVRQFSTPKQNFQFLLNIRKEKSALDRQIHEFISNIHAPEFTDITQGHTVGYLGMKPPIMLYNDFNFYTSPSTISFASWNTSTIQADAAFFANNVDYLIIELETIDRRYLPLDSSITKLRILSQFSYVTSRGSNLLLKKRKYSNNLKINQTGPEIAYKLGDWQTLPIDYSSTWININLTKNLFESLLSVFYKPMTYEIELKFNNGNIKSYRYLPALGKEGVLLIPEILSNDDLVAYITQRLTKNDHPNEFRILCKDDNFFCKREGIIRFSTVAGL